MKTTTTIELTEKEEQIIHLGLGAALAGLFGSINDDDNNNKNPFHVKITVDEIVKLEEKLLLLKLMEEKAVLVASK